ncbi:MAG: OsmC family protein [Candidatus Tyrphobacter sp.]
MGTASYRAYGREYEISGDGKTAHIAGSSAPAYRGNAERYNPEELLVAALSACHMLWFLHVCADAGVIVTAYVDSPDGMLVLSEGGSGQFREVALRPVVSFANHPSREQVEALHDRAHESCFLARSMKFPVTVTVFNDPANP